MHPVLFKQERLRSCVGRWHCGDPGDPLTITTFAFVLCFCLTGLFSWGYSSKAGFPIGPQKVSVEIPGARYFTGPVPSCHATSGVKEL